MLSDNDLVADLAAAFGVDSGDLRSSTVIRLAEEQFIGRCDAVFGRPGARAGRIFAAPSARVWPDNMEGAARSGL